MFTIHATKKLLDRVKAPIDAPVEPSGALGNWYATAWFSQPQLALVVNETTLVPVIMPLAPARSLIQRFPETLAKVLTALDVDTRFIASEVAAMGVGTYARTASRSILGVMNDYTAMAKHRRKLGFVDEPVTLAAEFAHAPSNVLRNGHGFPDLELQALVTRWLESP